MTETPTTYRTRQIQLAEKIADEVGLLIETNNTTYAKMQIRRLAQLHWQRMAEKAGETPCA